MNTNDVVKKLCDQLGFFLYRAPLTHDPMVFLIHLTDPVKVCIKEFTAGRVTYVLIKEGLFSTSVTAEFDAETLRDPGHIEALSQFIGGSVA